MKKALFLFLFFVFAEQMEAPLAYGKSNVNFKVEMLPWVEADRILPKYVKFTVLDVETGKKFSVQRRAGSSHADVQPLTSRDTAIMKEIYNGEWTWKRRAIIVIYKNHTIAASMHGMPHGAGALENNFPGHFCIHFFGSTTHRTKTMDLSHMLMIYKAAGTLEEYLNHASPYEVVQAYIAGLKQQDRVIVTETSLQRLPQEFNLVQISNIRITRMPLLPAEDLKDLIYHEVPVEVDITIQNQGHQKYNGVIYVARFAPSGTWQVDCTRFLQENSLLNSSKTPHPSL